MPHYQAIESVRDDGGKLPAYAWPGGYPLVYMTHDGAPMCPECANGGNGSECNRADLSARCRDDRQWILIDVQPHYEGEPVECAHCGKQVESSYGVPDAAQ